MAHANPKKSQKTNVKRNSMEMPRKMVDLGPITHTPTFADHILMILPHLKLNLPPGWFPLLRERKDQSKLFATDMCLQRITGLHGRMIEAATHRQVCGECSRRNPN